MKILMSLAGQYFPPDIRVEKEARTLLQAGHEVFLLCENRKDGLSEETVDGMKVLRIKRSPPGFWRRIWNASCCRIYSPLWRKSLAHIVEQEKIEALHIHDLPMVKMGLSVAQEFSIPLVADMHENYPIYVQVGRHNRNLRNRLLITIVDPVWVWKLVERHCLKRADRVIAVSDESREHFVQDCDVPSDKATVVMNAEDPENLCSIPIKDSIVKKYQSYFTISYIGGFSHHRGIQTAITAMPEIVREIPNARLLLVGSGTYENELRTLAQEKEVAQAVEFTGHQPFSLVPSYVAASQVCLIPYIFSAQTDASSPHKLFQYMAMGKPVIVSSMRSLGRVISETGAGLVFTAGDPVALAEAVIKLYKDKSLALRMGEAGEKAVREKYSWAAEGIKLIELYKNLAVDKKEVRAKSTGNQNRLSP